VRYIYYIVKEMPTMPNPGNRWGNRVKRNAELDPSFLSGEMPIMPNFAMALIPKGNEMCARLGSI
jgi:hypothetical protein